MMSYLYPEDEVTFDKSGFGPLPDMLGSYAEEEANSYFELYFEYPLFNSHERGDYNQLYVNMSDYLIEGNQVTYKPSHSREPHAFRIYKTDKQVERGIILVWARTRTADLRGNPVRRVKSNGAPVSSALRALKLASEETHPFSFTTNIQSNISFEKNQTNVLDALAGEEDSILSITGGQMIRTNNNIYIGINEASKNVVEFRLGKNIEGLSYEVDYSNIVTAVIPFYTQTYKLVDDIRDEIVRDSSGKIVKNPDGSTKYKRTVGKKRESLDNDVIVYGDTVFSQYTNDYSTPFYIFYEIRDDREDPGVDKDPLPPFTKADINNRAVDWFEWEENVGIDEPEVYVTVDVNDISQSSEYSHNIDLAKLETLNVFDKALVYVPEVGIDMEMEINYVRYNGVAEKNIEVRLGTTVTSLQETVLTPQQRVFNQRVQQLDREIAKTSLSSDGKARIYWMATKPVGSFEVGDLWFDVSLDGGIYVWDGYDWVAKVPSDFAKLVEDNVNSAIEAAESAMQEARTNAEQALVEANKYADEQAALIKQQVDADVNNAISTAEDAKETAESSYTNAVAEAERLAGEQSAAFNAKFEENATAMSTLSQAAKDADTKAKAALDKAGVNANLLTTHQNTLNTIKNTTIPNVNKIASDAMTEAKSALSSASSAMTEAQKADGKIADYVTKNGLVNGTTVDSKIDTATGEISKKITTLETNKLDSTTYTNFYENDYKATAQGVTDTWTAVNKVIDANGNSTDAFAKAVYDRNATRQSADFKEVTKNLVQTATYTAGINGINSSITTIRGNLDSLIVGGENLVLNSNFENETENWTLYRGVLEKQRGVFTINGRSHNFIRLDASSDSSTDARVETDVTLDSETEYVISAYVHRRVYFIIEEYDTDGVRTQRIEKSFYGNFSRENVVFTTKERTSYVRVVLQSKLGGHGLVSLVKLERGNIPTAWSKSPHEQLGKVDFQIFKGDYEKNDQAIKNRLTAIDSGKEGSVIYNANKALSTAQGNTSSITTLDTKVDNLKVGGENLLSTTADGYADGYLVGVGNDGSPPVFSSDSSNTISGYIDIGNKGLEEEFVFSKKDVGNEAVNEYFRIVWISEFGNVLRRDAVRDNVFVTKSPSNAVKVRFSFPTGSQAMMQRGNKPTEYVPSLQDQLGKSEFTLFKNTYESTSKSILSRLTAIDSSASGSVVTRLNKTESTANGNSTLISTINKNYVKQSNIDASILADKKIKDTRSTNQLPSWYFANYPSQEVREFKQVSTMGVGSGSYGILTTNVPWTSTSGGVVRQSFETNAGTYIRQGTANASAWYAWSKQIDTSDTTYQKVTQTSSLYERVLGSTSEASVKNNISRIVQTSEIIQQTITSAMNVENRNLLITKNATKDSWLAGNESYPNPSSVTSSGTSTSPDLIEVKNGDKFTLSKNETTLYFRVSFLNSSKKYIGRYVQNAKLGTITPPSGTAYMWVSYPTNADAKIEKGSIATGYSPAPEDTATQSQFIQLADNINLKVSSDKLISEINLSKEGVRIAGKNIQLDGNVYMTSYFQVPNANIKDLAVNKITGTTAEFKTMVTKGLTADVISSTMIKADTALFDMLFSTTSATTRLVARGAWITNANIVSLDASKITAGTINSARINATQIVTNGLSANVVKSTHIQGDTALIDKVFATTALIQRLTSKTAFISSIQAISISASKITSGTLDASKATIINIDANKITANQANLVKAGLKGSSGGTLDLTGDQFLSTASDGSQVYLQNGVMGVRRPSKEGGGTIGQIGYVYDGGSPTYTIRTTWGSHFGLKQVFYDTFTKGTKDKRVMYASTGDDGVTTVQFYASDFVLQGDRKLRFGYDHYINGIGNDLTLTGHSSITMRAKERTIFVVSSNGTNNYASMHANLNMQGNTVTNTSDIRLKRDIVNDEIDSLSALMKWQHAGFNYINPDMNQERQFSVIAQSAPDIAFTGEDGYLQVALNKQVNMTSHALQQHVIQTNDKVEQLEAKIASLQEELALLKGD